MPQDTSAPSADQVDFVRLLEEVAAVAQIGLTYSKDQFDLNRYIRLQVLAAKLLSLTAGYPFEATHQWLQLDRNYATPKLDVRALILRGSQLLLIRERIDGLWALPGGWCDINRSPSESIETEVAEETGLVVRASRLLAFFDKNKNDYPPQLPHTYKCFFLCDEIGGALLDHTLETDGVGFFDIGNLPPLSLNRITPAQIRRVFEISKNALRPTEFD